jgi:hypothetical protein
MPVLFAVILIQVGQRNNISPHIIVSIPAARISIVQQSPVHLSINDDRKKFCLGNQVVVDISKALHLAYASS